MNVVYRLLYSGLVIALAASQAGAISLSQALDKTSVAYEEQAELTITIMWQGGQAAYLFDRPLKPTLDKLKVQKFSTSVASQATDVGEVTTKTFTFALAPTGSGTARIEPITVHYVSWPDSIPGDLVTEAMTLTVAPAKQVVKAKGLASRLPTSGWIALAVVLVGGVGAGLLAFMRTRRKPVVEVVTPVQEFLEKLTALKNDAGSDLKKFQTGLYRHLVTFLEQEHKLPVAGKSAEEIATGIQTLAIPEPDKQKLCGWLLRADREKFTPLPPAPGETIRLETELRQYFETVQSRR